MTDRDDVGDEIIPVAPSGNSTFHEVKTPEQAKAYLISIVTQVHAAREACDVVIPGDNEATVRWQQKAYRSWMIRYGQALGALTTLMHCRLLNDVAYNELRDLVFKTGMPTRVGEV